MTVTAVRKDLDAYTKTTPPHVRAARKQQSGSGGIVEYVMTQNGPEPLGEETAPDHPSTAWSRALLGRALVLGGERDAGAASIAAGLERLRADLGPAHSRTASAERWLEEAGGQPASVKSQ